MSVLSCDVCGSIPPISIDLADLAAYDEGVSEEDRRHSMSEPPSTPAVCSESHLSRRVDEVVEEVKEACLPLSDPLRDLSCDMVLRSPVNDVKEEIEEARVKVEVKWVLEASCQRIPVRRDMGLVGGRVTEDATS